VKCKLSLFAWYRVPSMQLASNSLERYVDANSCLLCHRFVTTVHFEAYFYRIKIMLATGRLINIDKLTSDEAN